MTEMYKTGNPVPSNAPKDFSDNAITIDNFINNTEPCTENRFGQDVITLKGLEKKADEAIDSVLEAEIGAKDAANRAEDILVTISALNSGQEYFLTQSELLASKPEISKKVAKALDTNKVWLWTKPEEGLGSWTDTGLSELDLAKEYFDSILKDINIPVSGTDLNDIRNFGNYYLDSNKYFKNLPENIASSAPMVLRVSAGTPDLFFQEIYEINRPSRIYRRMCQNSNGAGKWLEPLSRFQRVYDSIDPSDIAEAGTYVLTNGKNLPDGFLGTAMVDVERFGGFKQIVVTQTSDIRKKWSKTGSGEWFEAMPFPLTNDRFPDSYNFRGLFTDADFNSFISEGNSILNGKPENGASWISGTQSLFVRRMGAFVYQHSISHHSDNKSAWRIGMIKDKRITAEWNRYADWSDSQNTNRSSLSGKTIVNIGDSITEQGDWIERICDRYGAKPLRFGFGGCRTGKYASSPLGYDKQCMYNIAKYINTGDFSGLIEGAEWTRDHKNDDNTPQAHALASVNWNTVDILVISFGTNDWTGIDYGDELVADPDGMTTRGALCYAIEQIQEKYPHIQIVLVGMSFRLRGDGDPNHNSDNFPINGRYLKDYQKAILDVGEKYHIPAYDMYRNSGVNEQNHKQYLRDGVHPIPGSGYQHWADKIGSFLNSSL